MRLVYFAKVKSVSRFWSRVVQTLTPYVPGEQPKVPDLVKLNTNENPYGPSPRVLQALRDELTRGLHLYPDPDAQRLKNAVAGYYGVTAANVFVGNGSDEVLAHIFNGLLKHERPILFPDVTYSFYPVYCRLYDVAYRTVPLTDALTIDPDDYAQPCGGVIFPNPNAPTGVALPLAGIKKILDANADCVVVVDEAYVDFGAYSAIELIGRYANLLVVQTLSKSRSLAGLRVGFAVGHADLIEALERIKNSFNSYPLDRLAIAGAVAAFEDEEYFQETRRRVMQSREHLSAALGQLGFTVLPSQANFLFVHHPRHAAKTLASQLRDSAIIVRHFQLPRIDGFLRITIGTEAANARLLARLRELVG